MTSWPRLTQQSIWAAARLPHTQLQAVGTFQLLGSLEGRPCCYPVGGGGLAPALPLEHWVWHRWCQDLQAELWNLPPHLASQSPDPPASQL